MDKLYGVGCLMTAIATALTIIMLAINANPGPVTVSGSHKAASMMTPAEYKQAVEGNSLRRVPRFDTGKPYPYDQYIEWLVKTSPPLENVQNAEWHYAVEYRWAQMQIAQAREKDRQALSDMWSCKLAAHWYLNVNREVPKRGTALKRWLESKRVKLPKPAMLDAVNRSDPPGVDSKFHDLPLIN